MNAWHMLICKERVCPMFLNVCTTCRSSAAPQSQTNGLWKINTAW